MISEHSPIRFRKRHILFDIFKSFKNSVSRNLLSSGNYSWGWKGQSCVETVATLIFSAPLWAPPVWPPILWFWVPRLWAPKFWPSKLWAPGLWAPGLKLTLGLPRVPASRLGIVPRGRLLGSWARVRGRVVWWSQGGQPSLSSGGKGEGAEEGRRVRGRPTVL